MAENHGVTSTYLQKLPYDYSTYLQKLPYDYRGAGFSLRRASARLLSLRELLQLSTSLDFVLTISITS
jgi:hypothetical protein